MADVYDGLDQRLERPVAVKVLRPDVAAAPEMRRRFEIEARAAAGLSHPNIVAVYDTGEAEDGTPYIVMERLPGTTLAERIAGGAVESSWLRLVAGDVLGALAMAHDAGIVHRDVKPGNILISSDGCAKVADFGIAKTVEEVGGDNTHLDLTASNLLLGTPAYLAPERLDGKAATPQSDLYSLGVVLYEAATGLKPFAGSNAVAVAAAIHGGDHTPVLRQRPDLDPDLGGAIERAMARQPAHRFADARSMAEAIGLAAASSGSSAAVAGDATTMIATGATVGAASGAVVAEPVAAEPTQVVPAAAVAAAAASPAASPPLANRVLDAVGPLWQTRRAWVLGAVAALVLFLVLVSIAPANPGSPAKASTTPSTSAPTLAPTTTPPTTAQPAVKVRAGKHHKGD
ncbi:MAG: eukaryotic-like serine/threonine-protein kinase [Actinomycetota bacterium]|jgi:non-specific serine/threonine protein kinase/serine/threonine-protein kinase|nr:eukaryotic-like serine/threonine-protein kinase [Actinomycetota bacterium]